MLSFVNKLNKTFFFSFFFFPHKVMPGISFIFVSVLLENSDITVSVSVAVICIDFSFNIHSFIGMLCFM